MGLVHTVLAKISLRDAAVREIDVEYNAGGTLHLQSGVFRMELTRDEFLELADACRDAAVKLRKAKNLD